MSGFGIAARPEIPCLWSSLRTVLVLTGFVSVTFSSAVTFAAVVFLFFVTILRNVRLSRSLNTHFRPRWCLSDAVFSVLLYAVIILDTVPRETPKTSATLVTEAPTIWAPTICPRSNSVSSDVMHKKLHRTLSRQQMKLATYCGGCKGSGIVQIRQRDLQTSLK